MEPEDVIRFESLDDGAQVLAFAHATAEGRVALALAHELDGDLELSMNPEIAERLAETLSRAARDAERGDD